MICQCVLIRVLRRETAARGLPPTGVEGGGDGSSSDGEHPSGSDSSDEEAALASAISHTPSRRMLRSSGSVSVRSSWRVSLLEAASAPGTGERGATSSGSPQGLADGAASASVGRRLGASYSTGTGPMPHRPPGCLPDLSEQQSSPAAAASGAPEAVPLAVATPPPAAAALPRSPAAGAGGLRPSPRPPQELVRSTRGSSAASPPHGAASASPPTATPSASASAVAVATASTGAVAGPSRSFTGRGGAGAGGGTAALMLRGLEEAASRQAALRGGGSGALDRSTGPFRCRAPATPPHGAHLSCPQNFLLTPPSLDCEGPGNGEGDACAFVAVATAPSSPAGHSVRFVTLASAPQETWPGNSNSGGGPSHTATPLARLPRRLGTAAAAADVDKAGSGRGAPICNGSGSGGDDGEGAVGAMGSLSFRFPRDPLRAAGALLGCSNADSPTHVPAAEEPPSTPDVRSLRANLSFNRSFTSGTSRTRVVGDAATAAGHYGTGTHPAQGGVGRSSRSFSMAHALGRARSIRDLPAPVGAAAPAPAGGGVAAGASTAPTSPALVAPCNCDLASSGMPPPSSPSGSPQSPGGGGVAAGSGHAGAEATSTRVERPLEAQPRPAATSHHDQTDLPLRPTAPLPMGLTPHGNRLLARLRGLFA
ncbi:hypothetical protein HYH02_000497 [Chlamydomonas schloesseri]|uniref:Uncharacterized protein n=1 Tax=Chlamydomonas schloesseri TaxID=2026947 RepID=A0A836BCN4_9CHLO|nr:hypothetical protein HYH02_000497 [Chlamydomonas schloesseri]|eukprot:KAG2454657.1 hypothetical protein HYH02_000497 [Chlamydomonas schloesseri]